MKGWCSKCNKPVDEIRIFTNDFEMSRKYSVFCHGEAQEQILPEWMIENFNSIEIHAFRDNPALPEPPLKEIVHDTNL